MATMEAKSTISVQLVCQNFKILNTMLNCRLKVMHRSENFVSDKNGAMEAKFFLFLNEVVISKPRKAKINNFSSIGLPKF